MGDGWSKETDYLIKIISDVIKDCKDKNFDLSISQKVSYDSQYYNSKDQVNMIYQIYYSDFSVRVSNQFIQVITTQKTQHLTCTRSARDSKNIAIGKKLYNELERIYKNNDTLINNLSVVMFSSIIGSRKLIKERIEEFEIIKDDKIDHSDKERHLLFSYLKRIYESTNKLIMNLTKMIFISEFYTSVPYIEATERIEEFEIIKDYKIDMISLESLYNFYKQPFNYELPSN